MLELTGRGHAYIQPDLLSCSLHQTVFTHPGEYPSKFSGRSSGSPSSFSGTFPHEWYKHIVQWRIVGVVRPTAAGAAPECLFHDLNRGTGFPFHLSPRPWGRAPRTRLFYTLGLIADKVEGVSRT